MKKGVNTYWDNSPISMSKRPTGYRPRKSGKKSTPQWFIFTIIVSITFLLCLAINFRAVSEAREQSNENIRLNEEIKKLTTENAILEQEIKDLHNDPKTIEREARKIGMGRPNEKVLVPID